jgi:hypothetical protein
LFALLAYVFFLLVLMPIMLFLMGRFANYCTRRKPGGVGFPLERPLDTNAEGDRG